MSSTITPEHLLFFHFRDGAVDDFEVVEAENVEGAEIKLMVHGK